jgi:hypothetical protein
MDSIQPPAVSTPRPDVSGLLTAAALFWFEAWGFMGLAVIALVPLLGFMHGTYPPTSWTDGSAVRLLIALAAVAVVGVVGWATGGRRPRVRAALFLAIGAIGLLTIGGIAVLHPVAILPAAVWLVWPSIALVKVWAGRFSDAPRAAAHVVIRCGSQPTKSAIQGSDSWPLPTSSP